MNHRRLILTHLVKFEKYKRAEFGRCPRVLCRGEPCLPCGVTDVPYNKSVKIYCPRCEDLYNPRSSRHSAIDGAYFGTTFAQLLIMSQPSIIGNRRVAADRFCPKVFGFKIHHIVNEHRFQDVLKREEVRRDIERRRIPSN